MKLRNKFLISLLVITFSMLLLMATKTNATNLEDIITIDELYQDEIRLSGSNLYIKLDSNDKNGYIYLDDLLDKITINSSYTQSSQQIGTDDKIGTGNSITFRNKSSSPSTYQMNLYLMGDVYSDTTYQINVNDVIYLRQAIVGNDMSSNSNFHEETSDVNWSNGNPDSPQLGDIGDVIAIRKRTLKNKWDDDDIPVVTDPPTEPVDEKTEFDDPNSEDDSSAIIPEGFKVSDEEDEQSIDDGLVVIAPDGSEFVWIPVSDPSTMYGTDAEGNRLGKLYNFSSDGSTSNLNWQESTSGVMSWVSSTGAREPDYLSDTTSGDAVESNTGDNVLKGLYWIKNLIGIDGTIGTDNEDMITKWEAQLQSEFNNMARSVEKYNGFYIGRYETSEDNGKAVSIAKGGHTTYENSRSWYHMYQFNKEYSTSNNLSSVVGSGMIWGSQFDQMLIWFSKSGIDVTRVPDGDEYNRSISIGSKDTDKLKNIYDLWGCYYEVTMQASGNTYRNHRRRTLGWLYQSS